MKSEIKTKRVAYLGLIVILFLLILLLFDRIGPVKPEIDVLLTINEQSYPLVSQPISATVPATTPVEISVKPYYHGHELPPGEFTYKWCYEPEVKSNLYCSVTGYRGNVNFDYLPETRDIQNLQIFIEHDDYQPLTIAVLLMVEQ